MITIVYSYGNYIDTIKNIFMLIFHKVKCLKTQYMAIINCMWKKIEVFL